MDAGGVYVQPMSRHGTAEETSGVGPRAGRYVAQPSGYRAFLPAPLPPEPPIL